MLGIYPETKLFSQRGFSAQERTIMKRFFALLLAALVSLPLLGCGLFLEKHAYFDPKTSSFGNKKVFSGNGYTLELTDIFAEKKSTMGFDGYYVSLYLSVTVQIVTPEKAAEFKVTDVKSLLKQTIADNGSDRGCEVMEENGLIYYEHARMKNAGWNFAFKGSENYYLIQFICAQSDAAELKDIVFDFAKAVTVE